MNFPIQVPNPAIRRLGMYLRQLEALEADRVETVSSHRLAQPLGLTDAQVRKDLTYFGQFGRPGVGYEVTPLIQHLRNILGTDRISQAVLVGAGNLGKSITAYQGFRARGFELVAVFDNDPREIGQHVDHLRIQPMNDLIKTVSRYNARLAIIAVPATAAQHVADQLIAAGIHGILNFAPTHLEIPLGITVRNIDVAAELEQLNFQTNIEFPQKAESKEIMIVDDNEASVVFLSQIIEDNGYRYRVAKNGQEAITAMKQSRPHLVLLDLMMPRKSGITVFQEMKESPGLKDIPIIIVSGASEVTGVNLKTGEEISKNSYEDDVARRFGVVLYEQLQSVRPDGFIEKPIDPIRLSAKIKELLH